MAPGDPITYHASMEPPGEARDADDPRQVIERALLANWDGNLTEAEALFRQGFALNPNELSGRVPFAILLARTGRLTEAVEQLEAALDMDPTLTESRLKKARLRAPDDGGVLSLMRTLELRKQKPVETQEPVQPELISDLDEETASDGDEQAAISQTEGLSELPDLEQDQRPLPEEAAPGEVQEALEEESPAILEGETAKEAGSEAGLPPESAAILQTAREALQAERYEEALSRVEGGLAQAPEDAQFQSLKTEIEANQDLEKVRRYLSEADECFLREDYEGAVQALEAVQALLPFDRNVEKRLRETREQQRTFSYYQRVATEKVEAGNSQGALELVEKGLQLLPESGSMMSLRRQLIDRVEAETLLKQAHDLATTNPDGALDLIRRALALVPSLPGAQALEAQARVQLEIGQALESAAQERTAGLPEETREAPDVPRQSPPTAQSLEEDLQLSPIETEADQSQTVLNEAQASQEPPGETGPGEPEESGEAVGEILEEPMDCPVCGSRLHPEARFCHACGHPVASISGDGRDDESNHTGQA